MKEALIDVGAILGGVVLIGLWCSLVRWIGMQIVDRWDNDGDG